jgi:hypothetical protein
MNILMNTEQVIIFFNDYKKILQEALDEDKERKKLGFSAIFEFAVYEKYSP